MPRIILFGNEKGGAGKTTAAIHLSILLCSVGFKVVSVDLDSYQQSFTGYIENRTMQKNKLGLNILIPKHICFIDKSFDKYRKDAEIAEGEDIMKIAIHQNGNGEELEECLEKYMVKEHEDYDYVVIDSPGGSVSLSRAAHALADIVVTPINDSIIDIELLSKIGDSYESVSPGPYAVMLFEQKIRKTAKCGYPSRWYVMRNRVGNADTINSKNTEMILYQLSKKLGFKNISGFGNRNIFKELFNMGLCVLDSDVPLVKSRLSTSAIAAKLEILELAKELEIDLKK
ncbi:Putative ParA-like chromosome partitioning protein [Candidatus Fokinia solitaria]|uniref:ParA-like chromosome partitioning protein n=1 Tax=Candidatus Fokinia solitaria TaxID=1802984 RepID=A0A2U8BS22_9RICK|nr:division plane positioning ATPase MipZ [Candidatus Fokinia solitaria]AWD33105.1 Putative ParA-like chromosome partitioning protein [Candidatus Fokinia solitaria]